MISYAPWVTKYRLKYPYGKCQCGCGGNTPIARRTRVDLGHLKGEPTAYKEGHNSNRITSSLGMKVCRKCNRELFLDNFRKIKSGMDMGKPVSVCEECDRERSKNYHQKHRDKEIGQQRVYRVKNKKKLVDAERQRMSSMEYRIKRNKLTRNWRETNKEHTVSYGKEYATKYPERISARSAVNKAVNTGEFPPAHTMVCSECDEAQAAHWHHHRGYSQDSWLDVIPVCLDCHAMERRKI